MGKSFPISRDMEEKKMSFLVSLAYEWVEYMKRLGTTNLMCTQITSKNKL